MSATATLVLPAHSKIQPRTALIASVDGSFRHRLNSILTGMRWQVREACGGAEAWGETMNLPPQVIIVDTWLPDLDRNEFLQEFHAVFPGVDIITADCDTRLEAIDGAGSKEILYALRRCQDNDTAAWKAAPDLDNVVEASSLPSFSPPLNDKSCPAVKGAPAENNGIGSGTTAPKQLEVSDRIPELIGDSPRLLEVSRRIRKVAPRNTPVLIEGPTGSGKELVAEALHHLSSRNRKPFVAINCAAIPEALLEAELFGHTRGAFTGAVQGRIGRIEAADGGTLFLDEIGEMPLALQSKLLRFVETGELQRVGDNDTVRVDVRIIAATHQPLAQHTKDGLFRADLYYRLAVFLIRTPALVEHLEDLAQLVDHFLEQLGRVTPMKCISEAAMAKLKAHTWPGNVRELEHVVERATILAGDEPSLRPEHIDFGDDAN